MEDVKWILFEQKIIWKTKITFWIWKKTWKLFMGWQNKTLKKRIETTLEQELFYNAKFSETKENLQNVKKLKKFHEIYDEKIDSDKQFKQDLFKILKYLWEIFVKYHTEKIKESEINLKKCESVKGKEVLKYTSSDEVKKDLYSAEEFPSFEEIMKYKDEHKNAFKGVFQDSFKKENYNIVI